jgi:hypothetical protein
MGCKIRRLFVPGRPSSSAAQSSDCEIVLVPAQQPSTFSIQWLHPGSLKPPKLAFWVVNDTNWEAATVGVSPSAT